MKKAIAALLNWKLSKHCDTGNQQITIFYLTKINLILSKQFFNEWKLQNLMTGLIITKLSERMSSTFCIITVLKNDNESPLYLRISNASTI